MNLIARSLAALGWLSSAVLLAFGGAGVVARGDNFPGDLSRPELTWRYDQAMAPGVADAADAARLVAEATDKLADAARSALVDLLAARTESLADDLKRGDVWIAEITRQADAIDRMVDALPYVGSPELYGSGTRDRVEALRRVIEVVRPLPERWSQLEAATIPAVQVAGVMQAHDARVFEATQAGVREDYKGALTILATATSQLDQAASLRDQLSGTVDVSTLSEWLDRSRLHDEALAGLYQAVMGGKTDEIKAALEKQKQAEALLPPDTRALVVILGDIALGGVNQAAIAIETVRGSLGASLAALD